MELWFKKKLKITRSVTFQELPKSKHMQVVGDKVVGDIYVTARMHHDDDEMHPWCNYWFLLLKSNEQTIPPPREFESLGDVIQAPDPVSILMMFTWRQSIRMWIRIRTVCPGSNFNECLVMQSSQYGGKMATTINSRLLSLSSSRNVRCHCFDMQ